MSDAIKRYGLDPFATDELRREPSGSWIRYSDHLAQIDAIAAKVYALPYIEDGAIKMISRADVLATLTDEETR